MESDEAKYTALRRDLKKKKSTCGPQGCVITTFDIEVILDPQLDIFLSFYKSLGSVWESKRNRTTAKRSSDVALTGQCYL